MNQESTASTAVQQEPLTAQTNFILVNFKSNSTTQNESKGLDSVRLPTNLEPWQLVHLLNQLLENKDPVPYTLKVDDTELLDSIEKEYVENGKKSCEEVLEIFYEPQAIFKVKPVTRCSASLAGHKEAVLSVQFSPCGTYLASGGGDNQVRLWDLNVDLPKHTLVGHSNWILSLAFAPTSKKLASGSMDKTVRLWDPKLGKALGKPLVGHSKWITSLAWEPYHLNSNPRLVSASKDGTARVWDTTRNTTIFTLAGHTSAVTCVRWGGSGTNGTIYTASQDRTIKLWDPGSLIKTLSGHSHWVNSITLSTDYILRTGPFETTDKVLPDPDSEDAKIKAKERYENCLQRAGDTNERLVSCSDDFTLFLWYPYHTAKPIRMTGHQKLINHTSFSPDGSLLASASFDKSVKLWDAITGKYKGDLRGHVNSIYKLAWSADSRLLVTASKDSTCKLWNVKKHELLINLPGHQDEVYDIDWSPKGDKVVTGSKDKTLKLWRN